MVGSPPKPVSVNKIASKLAKLRIVRGNEYEESNGEGDYSFFFGFWLGCDFYSINYLENGSMTSAQEAQLDTEKRDIYRCLKVLVGYLESEVARGHARLSIPAQHLFDARVAINRIQSAKDTEAIEIYRGVTIFPDLYSGGDKCVTATHPFNPASTLVEPSVGEMRARINHIREEMQGD